MRDASPWRVTNDEECDVVGVIDILFSCTPDHFTSETLVHHDRARSTMLDRSHDNTIPCAGKVKSEKGMHSPQPTNLAFQLKNWMALKSLRQPAH